MSSRMPAKVRRIDPLLDDLICGYQRKHDLGNYPQASRKLARDFARMSLESIISAPRKRKHDIFDGIF